MCGRFYVDEKMEKELEDLVDEIDKDVNGENRGDVYPSENPITIMADKDKSILTKMNWGFPSFKSSGLVINARSESVLDKGMFRDSTLSRRCIIPATGFYEWDKNKNKVSFERRAKKIIYMAGIWKYVEDKRHFVILTTAANESMIAVHDRMPLILEKNEIKDWIFDGNQIEFFLHKDVPQLIHAGGAIQTSLF